jgi:hypothetical protein
LSNSAIIRTDSSGKSVQVGKSIHKHRYIRQLKSGAIALIGYSKGIDVLEDGRVKYIQWPNSMPLTVLDLSVAPELSDLFIIARDIDGALILIWYSDYSREMRTYTLDLSALNISNGTAGNVSICSIQGTAMLFTFSNSNVDTRTYIFELNNTGLISQFELIGRPTYPCHKTININDCRSLITGDKGSIYYVTDKRLHPNNMHLSSGIKSLLLMSISNLSVGPYQ